MIIVRVAALTINKECVSEQLIGLKQTQDSIQSDISVLAAVTSGQLDEDLTIYSAVPYLMEGSSEELNAEVAAILNPLLVKFRGEILGNLKPLKTKYDNALASVTVDIAKLEPELKPILDKIAKSAPLREMAAAVKAEKEKLITVLTLEADISKLKAKIVSSAEVINGFIDKRLELAGAVMRVMTEHPVSRGDDQLNIDIKPFLKSAHIQSLLKDRIKYQSNLEIREIVQTAEPKDTDIDGYRKAVELHVKQSIEEKLEFKGEYNLSGVLQEVLGNAFYLNYDLMLRGDSFRIMSPGKRALALLRIIVELDSSEHPIILDQPEDDLDNRSIYEGLATYLKSKKQSRQIIVVTHNPNVVVGGDSEYVVVANQTGQESNQDNREFRFDYVYGGLELSFFDDAIPWVLEQKGIKEHVCEILDGGKDAFQRREQLYSTLKGST
jgi:predicted ATPase